MWLDLNHSEVAISEKLMSRSKDLQGSGKSLARDDAAAFAQRRFGLAGSKEQMSASGSRDC